MTRRVEGLEILDGEELLKINLWDAEQMGIKKGEYVTVKSRRGDVRVKTDLTRICPKGVGFLTFHFHETPTTN